MSKIIILNNIKNQLTYSSVQYIIFSGLFLLNFLFKFANQTFMEVKYGNRK